MTDTLPEIHDRVAEAYQGTLGPNFMRATQRRIHWICARVRGENVLDLGCSQGIAAILLAREAKRVLAVDIDEQAIAYAQSQLENEMEHVRSRVNFLQADALTHDFESGFYDCVILGEVLEHLLQPAQLLKVAAKALRPNGQIIVTVPFGINDYFDHKDTFYLSKMYLLLNEFFDITEIEPVESWIAFVGNPRKTPAVPTIKFDLALVQRVESAFEAVEHRYEARLDSLSRRIKVLEKDKKAAGDRLKAAIADIERLQTEPAQQSSVAKEDLERARAQWADEANKKIRRLEAANRKLQNEREALRNSKSFRIGHALVKLAKKPGPRTLVAIARSFRKSIKPLAPAAKPPVDAKVAPATIAATVPMPFVRRSWDSGAGRRPRIAVVMDTFTQAAFSPEADIEQLWPDSWKTQLAHFNPDFVFIESAWHGVDGAWKTKVSHNAHELQELLASCTNNGIPTAFWNKEDPVHFSTFLSVAKQCSVVFTTDVDCIAAYKSALGHERVYLLPFAAQPKIHHPVETFDRKKGFNFAGSYYRKYVERQRDMATLLDTLGTIGPVEIYDRNADNPHPHYAFPDKYHSQILGALPFSEIDKAYKGYRFGINLNTIKQSQSMFARRVFEMMASNTPVVSNFSRGARLYFGDLIISSDSGATIDGRVRPLFDDESAYRKFRLAGLRKVMTEHTYAHRLSFILSKLFTNPPLRRDPATIHIVAVARTKDDVERIIDTYKRQKFEGVSKLRIISPFASDDPNAAVFDSAEALTEKLTADANDRDYFCLWSADDYYGENYLTDLALAQVYASFEAVGKNTFFELVDGAPILRNAGHSYQFVDQLPVRSSMVKMGAISATTIIEWLSDPEASVIVDKRSLSIDEFNYCKCASAFEVTAVVKDVQFASRGADLARIQHVAETMPEGAARVCHIGRQLDAQRLHSLLNRGRGGRVDVKFRDGTLHLTSTVLVGQKVYLWANQQIALEELLLTDSSEVYIDAEFGSIAQFVCEYYDARGQKISHTILRSTGGHTLVVPEECQSIRLGLRVEGIGEASVNSIAFGRSVRAPDIMLARSKILILTKQYPSYHDLYRYGFLHSRVRSYRDAGMDVDVCKIREIAYSGFEEFENIDIAAVDELTLKSSLHANQYSHVLVHALDRRNWELLKPHLGRLKIIVWLHGAEVQLWQRRQYEFERLDAKEVERQKKLSDQRLALWHDVFSNAGEMLKFVFVSQYFRDEIEGDFGVKIPNSAAHIIHNHIDSEQFLYVPKSPELRTQILSIRPFASRKYANDLTVDAILELSRREYFGDLHFTIVGEGPLFDELTAPLRAFPNVELHQRFMTHTEIADFHRRHGVVLTPTRMDSQGVSRDEAMSSGLVPITTRVAAIPEFVDSDSGIVVEPENPTAIADAVEYLYRNPGEFERLSAGAAMRVRAQSGVSQTIAKEIELFK
ncbi:MAG: methyltransferase domain-containing protein [Aliihoeflea sp.]|uniref:methyltransferase domain-containing protein n=1 Tax=Aliihoeflea sp. TaxID=2608088 RepID=UPI004033A3EF